MLGKFSERASSEGLSKKAEFTAKQSHGDLQNSCRETEKLFLHGQSQNIDVLSFNKCIFGVFREDIRD